MRLSLESATGSLCHFDDQKNEQFSENIVYCCYHCQHPTKSYLSVQQHWIKTHKKTQPLKMFNSKNLAPSLPFWFQISKMVQCLYCPTQDIYQKIKAHLLQNHPGKSFAVVNAENSQECGSCTFIWHTQNELTTHYRNCHSNTLNIPEIQQSNDCITDAMLTQTLAQDIVNRFMCVRCEHRFSEVEQFEKHQRIAHKNERYTVEVLNSDTINYVCGICRTRFKTEMAALDHMRQHDRVFMCQFCDTTFRYAYLVSKHHQLRHNSNDGRFRVPSVRNRLGIYLSMRFEHANGLVCTKADLINTSRGNIDQMISQIDRMNETEYEEIESNTAFSGEKEDTSTASSSTEIDIITEPAMQSCIKLPLPVIVRRQRRSSVLLTKSAKNRCLN